MNLGQKTGAPGAGSSALERMEDALSDEELGEQVSPLVLDAVGHALQAHFRAIADLPLPDHLLVLLAELEAREQST
jgi:hypothetical protein